MKPVYIFLLLYALFITGLTYGISAGLVLIPGVGIGLAFAFTFCINATMGSGLILLLVMNNMYHPTWGPAGFIGGLIPGLDFLPFWLGVVIAGIIQDIKKEKAAAGAISATVSTATNAKASAAIKNFDGITKPANDNQQSYAQQAA